MEAARNAKRPEVDPLSPEGAAKLAEYNAQLGVARALDPLFRQSAETAKAAAWADVQRAYPAIVEHDAEFRKFMAEQNAGINPDDVKAGKAAWRVRSDVGAQMFSALKKAEALEKAASERRAAETADRSAAVSRIARAPTGASAITELEPPEGMTFTAFVANKSAAERAAIMAHLKRKMTHS